MIPRAVLEGLARGSLEAGAWLLALWLATRLWPRFPAGARRALWWLGCLRAIAALAPLPALRLSAAGAMHGAAAVLPPSVASLGSIAGSTVAALPAAAPHAIDRVSLVVLALWMTGVLIGLVVMLGRLAELRRRWREAVPFDDPRVRAWRREWMRGRRVDVRVSDEVEGPVTIGVLRPGILVPAGSERLPDESLRLVLAHEIGHVRRLDALIGWIPATAQLLFWFHPLVRLAAREFLVAREEVCDADALRLTGSSPRDYGALLLAFGVGRAPATPGSATCGSPEGRHLQRRLIMLSTVSSIPRAHRLAAALVSLVLLVGLAPVRWVGAEEGKLAGKRHSTRVGFLLWRQGETTSRGAIDELDLEAARTLGAPEDGDRFYFRIDHRSWVTGDPGVIAQVRDALVDEDRYERDRRPNDDRRMALERENRRVLGLSEDLDRRERAIEIRAEKLAARRAELLEAGRSTRDLLAERDALDEERASIARDRARIDRQSQDLMDEMQGLYHREKSSWVERDRIHDQVMRDVERIGRRAVDEGRMEVFQP